MLVAAALALNRNARSRGAVLLHAPMCKRDCTGHGVCHGNLCHCFKGYAGSACDTVSPSCVSNCSGHGSCTRGACICDSFFTGPACDQPVAGCPNMCSGMGHCEYGRCKCAKGRAGTDCSLAEDFTCPGWPACGGSKRGVCIDRECSCHAGYHGKACEHDSRHALIAGCPANCTGHGACTPRPRAHPARARPRHESLCSRGTWLARRRSLDRRVHVRRGVHRRRV